MARRDIDVRLGASGVPVGTLIADQDAQRETSMFRYAQKWLENPRAFALSPFMPLQNAPFFFRKERHISSLPSPIEDGAPDSWGRRIIDKTSAGAHLADIDYLIETDDFLRIGALRYFDASGPEGQALAKPRTRKEEARVPMLHNMQDVILAARDFEADPDAYVEKRGVLVGGDILRDAAGSLGGARPKVNAIDEDGALWIVKLPKQNDTYAMSRAEVMALHLAELAGIRVAEAHVLNDAPHFPMIRVRRFDRTGEGYAARVPYISAQSFVAEDDSKAWSYEDIAMQLRTHGADPASDIHELYRRLCFGILVRNTDDHLRNHGFLRTARGWRLSPAFDINPEHRPGGYLQTPISEIHGAECSIMAALDAAPFFDLSMDEARVMIRSIAKIVSGRWREIGTALQMTSVDFNAMKAVLENEEVERALRL